MVDLLLGMDKHLLLLETDHPLPIPTKYRNNLRIGACSWKYDSWKGLIYRDEKKYRPNDYLEDYAKYFNTVEIPESAEHLRQGIHLQVVCLHPAYIS